MSEMFLQTISRISVELKKKLIIGGYFTFQKLEYNINQQRVHQKKIFFQAVSFFTWR